MLTGQPPNLPIIGRRVNAERQSLKLRAEIISLAAAFHCAFVKHLETGLLHLGALCLDIIIHNLERSERATKLRRKIGCSALDQLDAMLTHHRTAPQALRIGRDKRHVIDAAEISDGGIKIVHQKRAADKLRRGSILQGFKWSWEEDTSEIQSLMRI